MNSVGIVGSGIAGLHLALLLQKHQREVTLYSDRSSSEFLQSRLPNTVARFPHTIDRERYLGVNHWEETGYHMVSQYFHLVGENPILFRGDQAEPASWVDVRLQTLWTESSKV
jgi:2-polyprenyl-6-methoxyphenol hydroxylase-like FAD-dependent oxidoreductase